MPTPDHPPNAPYRPPSRSHLSGASKSVDRLPTPHAPCLSPATHAFTGPPHDPAASAWSGIHLVDWGLPRNASFQQPGGEPRPPSELAGLAMSTVHSESSSSASVGHYSSNDTDATSQITTLTMQSHQVTAQVRDVSAVPATQGRFKPRFVVVTTPASFAGDAEGTQPRLPPIMQVEKQQVTTFAIQEASTSRRQCDARFVCPVPTCGSTFTRRFNLKGASCLLG